MFWSFGYEARRILAPQPGIKPTPPVLEDKVLITGPPGKSPGYILKLKKINSSIYTLYWLPRWLRW